MWEEIFGQPFDIDRSIVVEDFETLVNCKVDSIDYQTYEITPGVTMDIPIPHTDGCGMIDSAYSKKNFMVRLPFLKGLLGSFNFRNFIREHECSSKAKDIWGKEYDIFEDDIQIIFTKSQLKMYKYFDSWQHYKDNFRRYGCEAGICNIEEDRISNAMINYQMLQTLYDATDDEITELCRRSNNKIQNISSSLKNALDFFRITPEGNEGSFSWQKEAMSIYPELLNDPSTKKQLRDRKNSMIKNSRAGHLHVNGKYTFILPDLYAFCEWLFMGIEVPNGLLENGEVFCRLYKNSPKLDCLRAPHLYIEHAVRNNMYYKKRNGQFLGKWFQTDAVYTSTFDPISKILMFDVDGDKSLIVADPLIISMAERVTNDVYPLYYEMHKASAQEITPQNLYNGLVLAFTGGRIGGISNDITKIWASGDISDEAKTAVKWLVMETNFTIDQWSLHAVMYVE